MKIIAFDLGAACGVAISAPDSKPIAHTEILGESGAIHASRFCQAMRMTARLIKQHKPGALVIEEPIAAGVAGGANRSKLAMGYRAAVFGVGHMHGIRCYEYSVREVRVFFIGVGNLKRVPAKLAVFEECKKRGWTVTNDNESDACAVLALAHAKLNKVFTLPTDGLFKDANHDASKRT